MSRKELQKRLEIAERGLKDRDGQIAELKDKFARIKNLVLNIGSLCGMVVPFRKDSRSWANKILKRTVDGQIFFSNESLDLAVSTIPSDDLSQDNFTRTKPTELFLREPYIMDRETSMVTIASSDDGTLNPHPGKIEENIEQPQNNNQKAKDGKLALRNTANTTQELQDEEFYSIYSTEGNFLQNFLSKETKFEKNSLLHPVCLPNRPQMDDSPGSSASALLIHYHESPSMSALPGEHKQDRLNLGEMPKLSGIYSNSNSGYSEEGKEPEVLMVRPAFTDITDRSLTSIEKTLPPIPSMESTERSSRERTSRERSSGHPSIYV